MGVQELRKAYQLQPHPEGGFYAETFRDDSVVLRTEVLPDRFKVDRPISTAIYFLVPTGSISHLHRIPSAEVWHFYRGEPLTIFELDSETGLTKQTVLGQDPAAGQLLQYTVSPSVWFGAYPTGDYKVEATSNGGSLEKLPERDQEEHYSFVGCTVAPAFEFADFELAKRGELVAKFPHRKLQFRLSFLLKKRLATSSKVPLLQADEKLN
ncbi:hypothetical protein R1sor_001783 [Riccia sorocarpa]|uniref:DUF985 domain-containing protein n=1 Tax=Riccia sorocarpa TaxID=122646 RepID=A0ABD3GYX4_9MARC